MASIGSPFSPLWIDKKDAGAQAARRLKEGLINEAEFDLVSGFIANGYCIIENAVDGELIDAYLREVEEMFDTRLDMWVTEGPHIKRLGEAQVNRALTKVLDTYMVTRRSLRMAFAPKLRRTLEIIFGEPAAVHQGLHFQVGSTQAIHQDTAYVVVKPALALAAAWVALEDAKPGSGELMYYRGSHRFGDFFYGEGRHWNTEVHGHDLHNHHLAWLHEEAVRTDCRLEYFWPKKGTLLIWHSDLAHGGAPIVNPAYTRKSIVFHYCPVSARPAYFDLPSAPMTSFHTTPEGSYASSYYPHFAGKEEEAPAAEPTPADSPADPPAVDSPTTRAPRSKAAA